MLGDFEGHLEALVVIKARVAVPVEGGEGVKSAAMVRCVGIKSRLVVG